MARGRHAADAASRGSAGCRAERCEPSSMATSTESLLGTSRSKVIRSGDRRPSAAGWGVRGRHGHHSNVGEQAKVRAAARELPRTAIYLRAHRTLNYNKENKETAYFVVGFCGVGCSKAPAANSASPSFSISFRASGSWRTRRRRCRLADERHGTARNGGLRLGDIRPGRALFPHTGRAVTRPRRHVLLLATAQCGGGAAFPHERGHRQPAC